MLERRHLREASRLSFPRRNWRRARRAEPQRQFANELLSFGVSLVLKSGVDSSIYRLYVSSTWTRSAAAWVQALREDLLLSGRQWGVSDVEEPIDDYPGDGDVEPERKCPVGDFHVTREFFAEGVAERDDGERKYRDSENRVREKESEIDRTNPAFAAEADDAGVEMKVQVAREKDHGARERTHHADFVRENSARADENVAKQEEHRAGGV